MVSADAGGIIPDATNRALSQLLMIHSAHAHPWRRAHIVLAAVATFLGALNVPAQGLHAPAVFHVSLGQASTTPVSGRLLIFAKLLTPGEIGRAHV